MNEFPLQFDKINRKTYISYIVYIIYNRNLDIPS